MACQTHTHTHTHTHTSSEADLNGQASCKGYIPAAANVPAAGAVVGESATAAAAGPAGNGEEAALINAWLRSKTSS